MKIKLLFTFLIACFILSGCGQKEPDIVIGAKDFTEQYILGNMLVRLIEENTDFTAELKVDMASDVLFASIRTGVVDLYVEYTGTVYGSYLRHSETRPSEEVYDISVNELCERYGLLMLNLLGFNNTFSLAVRNDTATENNLVSISDLAEISHNLIFGGSAEILSRFDGIPNLKRLYNMNFLDELAMDGIYRYDAIANDEIQVVEAFSTDGMLFEHELVVLEDDLEFFPPYYAAIIIRSETYERFPGLSDILDKLTGVLTDDVMRNLNYRADVLGKSPRDIAEDFLKSNNFIQ
ncbi:MAG: hypothetical protein FWE27_01450 [Defluviitaleaceae bacterium]|nr:hypothetical protein [Defluviitaleaceae bacterium]